MIKSFIADLKLIKDTIKNYASRNDGIPNTYYKIQKWLEQNHIKPSGYHINENLSVDIKDNLYLNDEQLLSIPIHFNQVNGDVEFSNNQLTSLKNCPKKIEGSLYLNNNALTQLDYLPEYVKGTIHLDKISEQEFKKLEKVKFFTDVVIYFNPNQPPDYFKKASYETHLDTYTLKDKEIIRVPYSEFKSYMEASHINTIMSETNIKTGKKVKI
jgi:hypothetical protein